MTAPSYWLSARHYLSSQDRVMAALVERYPEALSRHSDSFATLVRAIIGQQISTKAASAVCQRLETALGRITPQVILAFPTAQLQRVGLSRAKAYCLHHLAAYYLKHGINEDYWQAKPYPEVRKELLSIKGIGEWTADMFAIFYLNEPDIFSPGDLGLQKAVSELYLDKAQIDKKYLTEFCKRWRPYRTVAAWYLWRHLDPVPICY